MNRKAYRHARRLIRDNGRSALKWLGETARAEMARLLDVQDATDWLRERADIVAYCRRNGLVVNVRHTRPAREYRYGRWMGVAA